MIDLNLLRVFHTVYQERSVSLAAEKLDITQSAVSHGLRKLRAMFKDDLFVRSGAGMTPTARAQALFDPIHRIMETAETEVLAASAFDPALARREFSLAMGDMAEVVFLPPLLRHLRAHAPHCTLRAHRLPNEGIIEALERGVVELAIGNVPEAYGHHYSQTMFLHDYVVIVAQAHPRIKSRLTWAAFEREEHIVVLSGSEKNLQETLVARGIRRKVFLKVDGFLSVPWLVENSELIATVPTRLGDRIARSAGVRQLPLPDPAKPYALQSLWHPRHHNDPGHRWLREALFSLMSLEGR